MGRKVGDPSSKYAYDRDGSQLDKAIAEKDRLREEAAKYIREHIKNAVYHSGLLPETGIQIVIDMVREIYQEVQG